MPRKTNEAEAAFGFKAHSGWAALVVVGRQDGELMVLERSRVVLVEEEWAKQPYHAAENLDPADARKIEARDRRGKANCRPRNAERSETHSWKWFRSAKLWISDR